MSVAYSLAKGGMSVSTKYVNAEAMVVNRVMTQAVLMRFFLPLAATKRVLVPSACENTRFDSKSVIRSLIRNISVTPLLHFFFQRWLTLSFGRRRT